jgi:hypothetical protein
MSAATIIAIALAAVSLGYTARQVRLARDSNRFQVFKAVRSALRSRARLPETKPGEENPFYALRDRFAGDENERARTPLLTKKGYERALIDRIKIVHALEDGVRGEDSRLVERLVNAYNYVGELVDSRLFDPRSILGTYHLAIVRELFIAEPYIWHRMLFESDGRWGMRVLRFGEMARSYNEMNPIHRREVIFSDDESYGIILHKATPSAFRRAWWWTRVRVVGYPTLTSRSKAKQNRLRVRLADALKAPYPKDRHTRTRRARWMRGRLSRYVRR